ncbi:MAG TPA: PAS domain S-box protein [Phycisphaerae bacterium]|nr:PAS domain S-box protein [Phycisphaerae bacterium]
MTTVAGNKTIVIGGVVVLSGLIVLVDVLTPIGETFSILFVAVVGASMWLPGLRPIFVTALACSVLTALTYFLEFLPGSRDVDLVNRSFAIVAMWVVALLCAVHKRTERRAHELASIVESSEDAIYTRDLNGVITSWNAGAQKLFGYAAGEIVGRSSDLLVPADVLDEQMRTLEGVKQGNRVPHLEIVRQRKDGSRVPVSISTSPILDAGGKAVGVSSIARDISERNRTAEELQRRAQETAEAEERMRSVVNHVVDGIVTIDESGTVTTFNPAAEKIFGYAAEEVIGQNIKVLMPEPYHSQHDDYLGNYLRTGQAKIIGIGREVVGRRKDGTTFPMDLAISEFRLGQGRYFTGMVRDITERKRAEEALRSLAQFPDENPSPVVRIARTGTVLYANPTSAALGGQWQCTVGRPASEPLARLVQETLDSGQTMEMDLESGDRIFSFIFVPFADSGYVNLYGRDITDPKQAEEALRESEERFRGTFENAAVGIAHEDLAGRFLRFNKKFCEILGYSQEELVGKTLSEVTFPEDLADDLAQFSALIQGESSSYTMEKRFIRKDGALVWGQLTVSLQFNAAGKPAYCIKIVQDITGRKRAEEALRESERRFRTVTEVLPAIIWTAKPDGGIDYFNTYFAEYTGLPPEQSLSSAWQLLHPDDLPRCREKSLRAIAAGEPYEDEYRLRRADGAFRWQLARAVPLRDDSGRITKWLGSCIDIEDQKRVQGALREAKEAAESASRAKSEFLASMSHEIRTPMNGVFGMLDLALDMELAPEQRHYLERARASADLLLRVIDDILDFSKIEAGRLDLEPIPFSLRETLGEAIKAFGPRAHRKELELALHVRPEAPDGVIGDALRLGQVLTNLLGNAIKFTDHGEVILKVGVESGTESQACLHFSVTDTGPGIPADKQKLIFGAFAQADSSMARRFGGTGLGLAISARLVELMGGRIWVESEEGKGSTFHFTACFGLESAPVARPQAQRIDLEGLPVLAADDNETNRGILSEMLSNWRMRPTTVEGGRAALAEMKQAAAAGDPFPLVLLDAVMPDMDGFAVAQEIQNDPALAGAIIMMLTSADRGDELARCRELGIAAYLRKPVKQSELLNAVLAAMGGLTSEAEAAPVRPGIPAHAARRGLRVLVVEDNEFNQELAANLLKKWGHVPVLAGDGKTALDAWEKEPFDLILMDVQMPDMDGFAVTQAIRAKEQATNSHIPIIALTAHAMKGDRERCLAAGMDAYASKPIRAAELAEVIARLLPSEGEELQGAPVSEAPSGAVFDLETALAMADGDRALLRKMAEWLLSECPKLIREMRDSVLRGEGAALARAAHKLKGAVGSFGAQRAYQAALRLEELGDTGDVSGSLQAHSELEAAVEQLQKALTDFVAREP